ncbi:MAG: CRISPR-associated helicase Cas3' [Eubacteriales bacterium]|nr:CRISPR-associated helicase Cas3' [Eubacteriales bacterium]
MERPVFLAHIAGDGREQTVAEHLEGTARRSAAFAADFGSEDFGRLVGLAHDIGKNTSAFQRRLKEGGPKVDHATAGAVECAGVGAYISACCVIGHHGGLPDFGNPEVDMPGAPTFSGRLKKGMQGGIPPYEWSGSLPAVPPEPDFQDDGYRLAMWTRMLYSCLVDADYLDTEEFMSGGTVARGGYDSLPALWERLKRYIEGFYPPKGELNRLRCQILEDCTEAGSGQKGIYTLTVPTGGGKTLASLAFALRHAMQHGMRRIIYVIPYTSIIEQNALIFRSILGENNVLEHHSGAIFDSDEETSGEKSRQRLASENWDAPVVVTTAVQFFESIHANRSSKCRKLHNIANSVIIFDEAQMLPMNALLPCVGAISSLVADFGASAVLCTATQPVLNDLIPSFVPQLRVKEICPDTAQLYERFRRVSFRSIGERSNAALAEELRAQEQVLCIVNSRKAAQEIHALLAGEGSFHLSTLMCPVHRQAVLQTVRQRLRDGLPCRVVSTSLIEAGVDVDFPAVYREMAGLDSILQAAGRCNRNGKRDAAQSIVSIFTGETPAPKLFRQNVRATREALEDGRDPGNPESVRRYFMRYRSLIGNHLDRAEVVQRLRNGASGCLLPFKAVAEDFRMIDDDCMTVYIPYEDGAALCRELLSGHASRELYRRAGRYSVSIYRGHYEALLSAGDVQPLDAESAILVNPALYSAETGLSLVADSGKAEFI